MDHARVRPLATLVAVAALIAAVLAGIEQRPADADVTEVDDNALGDSNVVRITGTITCDEGNRFRINLEVTQGDTEGEAVVTGNCTGEEQSFRATVNPSSGPGFEDGTATVNATADIGVPGSRTIVDTLSTTEDVNLDIRGSTTTTSTSTTITPPTTTSTTTTSTTSTLPPTTTTSTTVAPAENFEFRIQGEGPDGRCDLIIVGSNLAPSSDVVLVDGDVLDANTGNVLAEGEVVGQANEDGLFIGNVLPLENTTITVSGTTATGAPIVVTSEPLVCR